MPTQSPALTVTLLGTGTSTGVPMIGCDCPVCRSTDPRNKRMRPSILVSVPNSSEPDKPHCNLLVDTTPEMRLQMLREQVKAVDGVLITHTHADHIFGMDDIRQFNYRQGGSMPIYGTSDTLAHIRNIFHYAFVEGQTGGGKPRLTLNEIQSDTVLSLCGVDILPLTVKHGSLDVLAYKFGSHFAYVTDVSTIPDNSMAQLTGLDTLVLDAVRWETHPTHFGVKEALQIVDKLQPRVTYLTHLSHDFDYLTAQTRLPDHVHLGYDGLRLRIPAAGT